MLRAAGPRRPLLLLIPLPPMPMVPLMRLMPLMCVGSPDATDFDGCR